MCNLTGDGGVAPLAAGNLTAALKSISGTQKSHTARQGDKRTHEFGHNLPYSACGLVEEASVGRLRGSDHDFSPASRVCLPTNWSSTGHGRLQIGPPSRPGAYSSRFPTMANGGSRRGLYGEGRRTAVAAETHSPPHVQRGQTGPQRGRPVGRATRREGDLSEGRPISEGQPSEGDPSEEIFRREG